MPMRMSRLGTGGSKYYNQLAEDFFPKHQHHHDASHVVLCLSGLYVGSRTPLDEAIAGQYWMCAKLLLNAGAEHTTPLTPDIQEAIDKAPMQDIRLLVKKEKVGLFYHGRGVAIERR